MPAMEAQTIGIGLAAASAAVSAFSAYTSRQAVDRSHRPFVWPTISQQRGHDGRTILSIRLHNDGSGTAFDVRWSLGSVTEGLRGKTVDDVRLIEDNVSRVVRALRPGEAHPALDAHPLERQVVLPADDVWWVLVRWTDAARVRWELTEQGPSLLRSEPRRLRTWRWQVWRSPRDW